MRETGNNLWGLRVWAGVLTAGLVLGTLPGCASVSGSVSSDQSDMATTASAVRDPVLQDIPKPAGFRLAADRSMVTNIGRFRLAQCEYSGPADAAQIKRFYEEYLPSAGFELRHWSLDRGEFSLDFESSAEVCNVRICPAGRNKSTVIVKVRPQASGSLERESRPPTRRPE
jgi:hypothetical protein